jgi:AbrB family looped-hinge helix DNA binding protein
MSIVTVKNKYQVVIPQGLREKIGLNIGDVLEAKVERGKITFTPKALVDRGVAQSLHDFKSGRSHGPFTTHEEFLASLHSQTKKLHPKKSKRLAFR